MYKDAVQGMKNDSGSFTNEVLQSSSTLFDDGKLLAYDEIIDQANKGKIDLVSELWTLRGKCGADMTVAKCNAMIEVFLNSNYPAPGNKHLAEIFGKYLEYEEFMKATPISSDLKDKERFEQVQKYRRKFFGEKDAKLVFGYEEAKTEYTDALSTFLQSTKNDKFDSRQKAYETLRKNNLGQYYNQVVSLESPFDKYQMELNLKSSDLSKLNESQNKEQVKEMRTKYFGKEANLRMEKVDEEIKVRDQKMNQYKKDETKFLSENAGLSEKDKQKKLQEFREKNLGKEEAENYTRMETLENYKE